MIRGWAAATIAITLAAKTLAGYQGVIGSIPGPPQPTSGKEYSVSGFVYNSVTQQPVRRALVRIQSGAQQRTAFTGTDGRFEMDRVPEGAVLVTAQRPGFSDPLQGVGCNPCSYTASYSVGSGRNDFRLRLIPNGKLSGKVVDEDGEPVVGLGVMTERAQITNGRKQFVNSGMAVTDDDGVYRFDDCVPGEFFVMTTAHGRGARMVSFAPRYFPNSETRATAQALTVEPGGELEANFQLITSRGFSVTGTVTGAPASGGSRVWIRSGEGMAGGGFFGAIEPNGQFVVRGVPEGVWQITAQSWAPGNESKQAEQEIVVKGGNLTGVRLNLRPPAAIPVIVKQTTGEVPANTGAVTNGGGLPQATVQIRLISTADSGNEREFFMNTIPNPDPNQPPSLSFPDVVPGTYKPSVTVIGLASCLDSVSYRGADIGQDPMVVAADGSSEPIVVNLRNDCAKLQLEARSSSPSRTGEVLLVPESGPVEAQVTNVTSGNTVSLANLAPGTYKLYVARPNEMLEYTNPEAMRSAPSQEVKLTANQSATISVDLPEVKP